MNTTIHDPRIVACDPMELVLSIEAIEKVGSDKFDYLETLLGSILGTTWSAEESKQINTTSDKGAKAAGPQELKIPLGVIINANLLKFVKGHFDSSDKSKNNSLVKDAENLFNLNKEDFLGVMGTKSSYRATAKHAPEKAGMAESKPHSVGAGTGKRHGK